MGTHRSHGGRRRHGTPRNGSRRERDLKKSGCRTLDGQAKFGGNRRRRDARDGRETRRRCPPRVVRPDSPYSRGAASATSFHEAVSGGVRGVKNRVLSVPEWFSRANRAMARNRDAPGTVPERSLGRNSGAFDRPEGWPPNRCRCRGGRTRMSPSQSVAASVEHAPPRRENRAHAGTKEKKPMMGPCFAHLSELSDDAHREDPRPCEDTRADSRECPPLGSTPK